jgi:hypothetical protein
MLICRDKHQQFHQYKGESAEKFYFYEIIYIGGRLNYTLLEKKAS